MASSDDSAPSRRAETDGAPSPVAVVHARYRQPGGEDHAVTAHIALLEAHGHRVALHLGSNEELAGAGALQQAAATIWNGAARDSLAALLRRERPVVVHVHNTFPAFSPAIYRAARGAGIPVVQTLHNYRLVCPNGLLFRDGMRCTECVTRTVKWPAVAHACYRDSRAASAVTAAMLATHALAGTWHTGVDAYIALTRAARDRFIAGGLPAAKIEVQPGFLAADPGVGAHGGAYALYVGRLSPEKGVTTLLSAWRASHVAGRRLVIAGSGPLASQLDRDAPGVEFLGNCENDRVLALMREATMLLLPSECDEGFPVTLLEAFATGLPVIAGDHGAMAEIITHDRTGRHFVAGDHASLAAAIDWAFANPGPCAQLGLAARDVYARTYTADRAYARLRALYERLTTARQGA